MPQRPETPLMIINRDPTPLDDRAALVIHDSVTYAMAQMVGI